MEYDINKGIIKTVSSIENIKGTEFFNSTILVR